MKGLWTKHKGKVIIGGVVLAGLGAFASGESSLGEAVDKILKGVGVSEMRVDKREEKK